MKRYGVLGLFVILFSIVAAVIVIVNSDKIIKSDVENEDISKVSHADCKYWYGQWILSKSQRDDYSPTSAKYLEFELDMKEKMIKLNESCYGK